LPQHTGGDHEERSHHTTSHQEPETSKLQDQTKFILKLEGAHLEKDDNGITAIVYQEITKDWEELYSITHVAQLGSVLSSLLEAACIDRADNFHYLDRAIKLPGFSQLAAKSLTQAISKCTPLDDDISNTKRTRFRFLSCFNHPLPTEANQQQPTRNPVA
jgi:hypothetical protein